MPSSERIKSPVNGSKSGDAFASFRRVATTTYAQGNPPPLSKHLIPPELTCISEYAGLGFLLVIYTLVRIFSEPFHQLFRLDDIRISYPHAEVEHVPVCTSRHQHCSITASSS